MIFLFTIKARLVLKLLFGMKNYRIIIVFIHKTFLKKKSSSNRTHSLASWYAPSLLTLQLKFRLLQSVFVIQQRTVVELLQFVEVTGRIPRAV